MLDVASDRTANMVSSCISHAGCGGPRLRFGSTLRRMVFAAAVTAVCHSIAAEPPRAAPATQFWLVNTPAPPVAAIWRRGFRKSGIGDESNRTGAAGGRPPTPPLFMPPAIRRCLRPSLSTATAPMRIGPCSHGNVLFADMQRLSCGRPFRLVVWSWPADRSTRTVRGVRPDIRMKACRSDAEAYYLARLLAGLPRGEPLSLLGFSLGCRTEAGTLQLLAGGTSGGRSIPAANVAEWRNPGLRPIRVVMLAAADRRRLAGAFLP